jgi:polyhydroxyalkanoate synthesis regulator phasin
MAREPVGYGAVRATAFVTLAIFLSACAGTGEQACDLLDDLPGRADRMSVEQMQEVADAARESDVPRIRALGEELTANLARMQSLEGLAPGAAVEVLQLNLDALRQACRNLEATD